MNRRAAPLLLLLLLTGPAAAQRECGNGLPCGSIPWPLPSYPDLHSPTPMPTLQIVVTAAPTAAEPTPGPSPTPGPTTGSLDASGLNDQLSTLQAIMNTTPAGVLNTNGTPLDTSQTFDALGTNAGLFFGYARGLESVSFGALTPLIVFTLTAMMTIISVKLITFLWPVLAAIFGFIRKIIDLILGFIPL